MTLVLVVDDVPAMGEQYAYDLARLGGYEVRVAQDGRQALERLGGEAVDCVILDLEMPGMDGFEVLRALERRGSEVPVIVYTGTGNYDRCIQAIRLGAYGFIDKAEPVERIVREIELALERRRLRAEVRSLRRRLDGESSLVGSSAAMLRLREQIGRVAPVPSTVLGTGATRAICSRRRAIAPLLPTSEVSPPSWWRRVWTSARSRRRSSASSISGTIRSTGSALSMKP
jgi:DNA-binding NtrC family response regulator